MDGSRAYSAMKVAGVSHRLLFLRSHVNSRAMWAGEMNGQPEIVARGDSPFGPPLPIFAEGQIRIRTLHSDCGTKMPDRPEWIHEVKHHDYRLIVQRATSGCSCSPATAEPRRAHPIRARPVML